MNSEIFSGIAGLFLNFIVEFIKAKLPETNGKWLGYVISYGTCLLVGGTAAYFEGNFDQENILSSMAAALVVSQGFYNLYFKPHKIDRIVNNIVK